MSSNREQTRAEVFEEGLKIRKQLVGAEKTEQSLAQAAGDEFMMPFHEYLNEACFGSIWARPGLKWRERSLITMAMLSALNRPVELGIHVRAAVGNGLTEVEIRECLLQVMSYCGIPAGVGAFGVASTVLKEIRAETAKEKDTKDK